MFTSLPNESADRVGAAVVVGTGAVATAIHGYHLLHEADSEFAAAVYGSVFPLLVAVVLVVAGYLLLTRDFAEGYVSLVAVWCLLGVGTLAAMSVIVIRYQRAEGVTMSHYGFVIANFGTLGGAVGVGVGAYDVQNRAKARVLEEYRDRLEEERNRFRALFANLPNAALRFEFDGDDPVIRDVNSAFEEVFGFEAETVVGRSVDEFVVPPDGTTEADELNTMAREGRAFQRNVRRKTAEGTRDFSLHAIPYRFDAPQTSGFWIAIDITEHKQHLRRLEVLNRVLRHDLRNSGNVIAGNAELIAENYPGATDRTETIRDRAEFLVHLGEKARQVERALDRQEGTVRDVNLAALVSEQADRLRRQYPEVDVTCDCPDAARSRTDSLVDTALWNVLENAAEHNDAADPRVEITVSAPTGAEFVTVAVEDNGPGLPRAERCALAGELETPLDHASGLGLWLVRWIVDESGGDVSVAEASESGTRLLIRLRRVGPDDTG